MNKRIIILSVAILIMVQIFLLSSCGNPASNAILETKTPSSTPSPQPSATATLTSTPTPTLTPTPVPVTILEAIQRGTFAELEVFNKGRIAFSPLSYTGQIISLSMFSPDGLQFVAITKRGLYAYDVESWQELFSVHLSPEVFITSINYSMNGSLFSAGDSSGIITFWDTKTWDVQNSFQVHKGAVTSLDISPDNMNFVTIGDQKEISVWNMGDGSLIKSQFRSKDAGPAHYSMDGKWLYISEATPYRDLIVWSSEELTLTNRLGQLGQRPPVQAVSPYTNTAAAFGFDTITLYDFDKKETTKLELKLFDVDEWKGWRRFSPTNMMFLDEKTLMLKLERFENYYLIDLESHAITGQSLEILNKKIFKNPEFLHILKSKEIKELGLEELGYIQNITPDGAALILYGWNEVPSGVFDLNQKTMKKVAIQEFPWSGSVFLSDGSLAGVDWPHPIRNPPFSNKKQQGEFTIISLSPESSFTEKSRIKQSYDFPDYIDRATISPNGKILAAGTADGNLYLWDLDTKELITTIRAHSKVVGMFGFYGAYSGLFFDEDGSHLATWGDDRKIKVFNMEDLSEVAQFNGNRPVFSPDGSHLAYVSSDNSIRLLSLFDEEQPKIFRGNAAQANSIAISPDETLIFSGSGDKSLKIWSIADEALLLDLPQYAGISSMVLDPDGIRLYVRTYDGVVSMWGHQDK
jgi:WD40 repeat protein